MTAAEQSAKETGADELGAPRGCVRAVGPDGQTPIWVRPPRGPGPWWRVKHPAYGHRLVQAATEDEALKKFFAEFSPAMAESAEWCRESMKMNAGRIARLAGDDQPAPATAPKPLPEKARK